MPAFSVNQFTAKHFEHDFYRANLYEVRIPSFMPAEFMLMVKGASIPASTVDSVEVPFQNRIIKIAGDRTFEDWNITVYNDADFKHREELETWMDNIQKHPTPEGATPVNYKHDLEVLPKQRDGEDASVKYVFHDAFPVSIDAIDLAWGTDGAPSEYGVTFAYTYWTKGTSTTAEV